MLAACPCWESDNTRNESNDLDLSDGTKRHKLFASMIADRVRMLHDTSAMRSSDAIRALDALLNPDDVEACEWAADYFMLHAPLSDYPWFSEHKMSFLLPDFSAMEGTPDAVCGNQLFDLKSRRRDYRSQMAAYALMIFEEHPEFQFVRVHILFAIGQTVEVYEITREDAMDIVESITTRATKGELDLVPVGSGVNGEYQWIPLKPTACEYCCWCKHQLTCPANVGPAKQVAMGYSEPTIDLTQWHPSQVTDGKELAIGLDVAKIVRKWAESWEFHAKDFAMKGGVIPGYELKETQGKIHCSDVTQAFTLAGLPQNIFLGSCTLRMNTSKKYMDRVGLVDSYATANNIPKSRAKKELTAKLAGVLSRGNPSPKLVKVGDADDESE